MSSTVSIQQAIVNIALPTLYAHSVAGIASISIQLFMIIYASSVLWETPKNRRKGRLIYMAISVLIFLLDAYYCLATAKLVYHLLRGSTSPAQTLALLTQLSSTRWMRGGSRAGLAAFWVGDGLLVYRCYLVWTGRKFIAILPGALWLGFVAISLYGWWAPASQGRALNKATILLSASVNWVVTILIAARLLYVRRRHSRALATFDSKMYLSVIGIVAESALPFAMAGILYAAFIRDAPSTDSGSWQSWKITQNISTIVWAVTGALSPQLINFRVTTGRSWAHSSEQTTLTALEFNHQTRDQFTGSDLEKGAFDRDLRDSNRWSGEEQRSVGHVKSVQEAFESNRTEDAYTVAVDKMDEDGTTKKQE